MGSGKVALILSIDRYLPQVTMIGKYYLNITVCCLICVTVIHAGHGGGPPDFSGKKKCRLQMKFPTPCIDLKPPGDVEATIQKCWNEAIDTDFKCQKMEDFMKERFMNKGKGKGKKKRMSPADFIFISSFHWLIYFTDDIAPNLCPLIKKDTREKIKTSFRNCFLKERNIEMGEMINVRQVVTHLQRYSGSITNMTTVIGIADVCMGKAKNQDDLAKCVSINLLGACMRDPYYKKPFSKRHSHKGGRKPEFNGENGVEGGPPRSGPPSGKPPQMSGEKRKKHFKMRCEPCFPLEAKDEVTNAWKTCLDSIKPADFFTKFMRCIKWEPKEDKPDKFTWLTLFTPAFKMSVFFNKKSQDAHLDCVYGKLGLGSTTDVNPSGFRDMVTNQLEGDEMVKYQIIESVDACAFTTEGMKINSDDFTRCTVDRLQKECDMPSPSAMAGPM